MNLKRLLPPATAAALLIGASILPPQSSAQADADATAVNALISELTVQQATIVENQSKIEEKLATLAESVRQARIFAARSGGKAGGAR